METKEIIYETLKSQTKITFEYILDMLSFEEGRVFTKAEVIELILGYQRKILKNIEKNKP